MHSIYMSPIPKAMSSFHISNLQSTTTNYTVTTFPRRVRSRFCERHTSEKYQQQYSLSASLFETQQVRMLVQWDSVNFNVFPDWLFNLASTLAKACKLIPTTHAEKHRVDKHRVDKHERRYQSICLKCLVLLHA